MHKLDATFSGDITLTGLLTIDPGFDTLVYYEQLFTIDENSPEFLPWASNCPEPPTMMSFNASLEELFAMTGYRECVDLPCKITLSEFTYIDFPSDIVCAGTVVAFEEI